MCVKEGTVPGGGQVEAQLQTEGEAGETKTQKKGKAQRVRNTTKGKNVTLYANETHGGWGGGGA